MELLILWALSGLVGTAILSRDKKAGTNTSARETLFTFLNCAQSREFRASPGTGSRKATTLRKYLTRGGWRHLAAIRTQTGSGLEVLPSFAEKVPCSRFRFPSGFLFFSLNHGK